MLNVAINGESRLETFGKTAALSIDPSNVLGTPAGFEEDESIKQVFAYLIGDIVIPLNKRIFRFMSVVFTNKQEEPRHYLTTDVSHITIDNQTIRDMGKELFSRIAEANSLQVKIDFTSHPEKPKIQMITEK